MQSRARQIIEQADTLPIAGAAAAVAAVVDHFWGLIDVMLIVVGLLWCLYMLSGASRALLRAAAKGGWRAIPSAVDDRKVFEGIARGVGVSLGIILLGFVEIMQAQQFDGAYMPAVAPFVAVMALWFAAKIAGHITDLHAEAGNAIRAAMDKARQRGGSPHDRKGDDP